MPLSGLCALERCGLACCGRHGVQRCAPGSGEKPVAFCRTLVLFSQKENSRNCVWVAGGLSPCECVLSSALICNALAWRCSRRRDKYLMLVCVWVRLLRSPVYWLFSPRWLVCALAACSTMRRAKSQWLPPPRVNPNIYRRCHEI